MTGIKKPHISGLDINGAQTQNRTVDTRIFNPLLYRLSYLGVAFKAWRIKQLF